MKTLFRSLMFLAGFALAPLPTANAEWLFNNYVPEGSAGPSALTNGNEFTVGAQPLSITKLGVLQLTGIHQETPVGIWRTSDEFLVGSGLVPPINLEGAVITTPVSVYQNWVFVNVTPFVLNPGVTYRIGTQNTGSDSGWGGTFDAGNGISVTPGSVSSIPLFMAPEDDPFIGFNFMYPSVSWDDASLVANAEFTLAPVPEPAEWAMLIAGLMVVGFVAQRRRLDFV
jgi:hypothetical protein